METMNAMEKMGKKKATAIDEVMDIIFIKKNWNRLKYRLDKQNRLNDK